MAAPVPTPSGVVKISHYSGVGNFGWQLSYTGGPPNTAALNTLATDARTAYSAHLAALLSTNSAVYKTTVLDLANPSNPEGLDATSVVGTRSGTQVPLQCAAIVDFAVARRYRGSKPKVFLPIGVDSDLANTIQWSTTFQSAVQGAWAAYVAALSGAVFGSATTGSQVSVSYYSGKHANPNPNGRLQNLPTARSTPLVSSITGISMRLELGSQRRRR